MTDKPVDPSEEKVVLLMQVPRTNDKKELAAEQMFASLHGLLTFPPKNIFSFAKQVPISFEIAVIGRRIGFYVSMPRYLKEFVEEQIYAQYPTVQIKEIADYAVLPDDNATSFSGTELKLVNNDALPIKTFQSFEVDPLAAITATLAKFDEDEEAWIQLILKPAGKNWHKRSERYVNSLRGSSGGMNAGLMSALWAPPENTGGSGAAKKLTEFEQARARGAEEKSHKLGFEVVLRIVYKGKVSPSEASLRLQSIIASYKQFNTTYLNGFVQGKVITDNSLAKSYINRDMGKKALTMNIEEMATLFHLPHTNVETPYILWASAQTAEPPADLPVISAHTTTEVVSPMGKATFRGLDTKFGLPRSDRGRHLYILGQTGVGKSALLELLTISDINSPYGFAVIDPHGDYAMSVLRRIPAERASDVIYFSPADTDFPIAFNPMEVTDPKLKTQTASELIGVLKRMFDSWGPRLEYILRYSILALLEYPDSTMLDITRILTDKKYRADVLKEVKDPVVRNFWTVEFASWNDKFAAEAVAPVLNKVGAFTANPIIRNIIGQPKSSFNIRKIMDERKILIVNLSRGLMGEDNAAILGALMVTKIQLAAMSRADTPTELRAPFYLYVDEFQNFATDSFATILSEARKYALNLTVANQYIAQMTPEVKDAVFGNVGSMIAFRMGADDARSMQRYFEPKFTEYDLVHMHNRHFVINMTINGEKSPAFSATTVDLPPADVDNTNQIVAKSREQYAFSREKVEAYVDANYIPVTKLPNAPKAKKQDKSKPAESKPKPKPEPKPTETPQAPVDESKPNQTTEPKTPAVETEVAPPLERTPENFPNLGPKPASQISQFVALGQSATSALSELVPGQKKKRRRRRRKKSNKTENSPDNKDMVSSAQKHESIKPNEPKPKPETEVKQDKPKAETKPKPPEKSKPTTEPKPDHNPKSTKPKQSDIQPKPEKPDDQDPDEIVIFKR